MKEPNCLFDEAPLFFTVVLVIYVAIGLLPAIAMAVPAVACAIGAVPPWCPGG